MRKSYVSPEIDFILIKLGTDICSSKPNAETPIGDVIVIEYDDIDDL